MPNIELMVKYRDDVELELKNNILLYWADIVSDKEQGGFYGLISNDNVITKESPKGCILNSRILWTFSAAYNEYKDPKYLNTAKIAYDYLIDYFWDNANSGLFWMVDYTGKPINTRKQVYNLAFGLYALSEYYKASGDDESLKRAIELYNIMEKHCHDKKYGGYIEALSEDWQSLEDMRLSAKDMNTSKSMNTNLHVMEAYTNLLRVWNDIGLKKSLKDLVEVTLDHIIDTDTSHFKLFFDMDWTEIPDYISYGHDIEGSWLLWEAAEVLDDGDMNFISRVADISIRMANVIYLKGVDWESGGLIDGSVDGNNIDEKQWWPQAEAMVGFLNYYMMTGDESHFRASYSIWEFVKNNIVNKTHGEWFMTVTKEGKPFLDHPKVEPWKCPYHNGRACMEVRQRLNRLIKNGRS